MTTTSHSAASAPVRVTDLRRLNVKFAGQTVETVECLAYDHAAAQVVGVHLRSTRADVGRQVRFEALDLSRLSEGELRLEPPVLSSAPETDRRPIESVSVRLPSGATASVRDALIDRHTGRILLYELGLEHGDGPVIQVKPDEIALTLNGEPWQVAVDVEARLRTATG